MWQAFWPPLGDCRRKQGAGAGAAAAVPGGGWRFFWLERNLEVIELERPQTPNGAQPSSQAARPGPPNLRGLIGTSSCCLPALASSRFWS